MVEGGIKIPMSNTSGIYAIVCTSTNKYYIGQAVNIKKRWATHLSTLKRNIHFNIKLQRAWNKYGESSFCFIILEECNNLMEREQFYIDKYESSTSGFNLRATADNSLGWWKNKTRSEETKRKISIALTGHKFTNRIRKPSIATYNFKYSRLGKKNTPEHNKKISLAASGERSSQAKITERDAREILTSVKSIKELAIKFNIAPRTVRDIKLRHTWKHISL